MNWSSLLTGAAKFATALAGNDPSAPAATVDGHTFTAGDIKNGYAGLKAAMSVLEDAVANPTPDKIFNVVEAIERAAAKANVPYANVAYLVTLAAQFAVDNNLAARPGNQLPSWAGGDNSNPSRGR